MSGWRYTANIPSYINAKDSSGEPVVVGLALMHFADHLTFQLPHKASAAAPPPGNAMQLYRVNVLIQNLEDTQAQASQRAPFFVLRRYNQFRQLYDAVRFNTTQASPASQSSFSFGSLLVMRCVHYRLAMLALVKASAATDCRVRCYAMRADGRPCTHAHAPCS